MQQGGPTGEDIQDSSRRYVGQHRLLADGRDKYTDQLMNANQRYREYYIFPAGILLTIPDTVEPASDSLPPWRKVAG